ncbi:nicotinate-nucleotide adenylyltransferase [Dethiobacter alkaliphilus]|uniref:Probable nicotinate-nucleotide adenylyltransferase n=1 Tax=Dethiobacter alkaliphilus AHT 1 TaxID=555088 RepID=C0GEU6_DETAL|nr:nicotinate-nucleotide adenylyltransferase [Dethiobacter alkaliphilus]EEG78128.1 nicotinate (nicotinamide) nucleotide adenylyltransferase [Dethiobacter alkaliphilus AHT 1]
MTIQKNPGKLSVGIMGGTFDPIHMAHLVTAEEVRIQFDLDRVVFVPSGNPPHKEARNVSDQEHRYLMTELATISNPYFSVSRVEIDRPDEELTYTIDTIRYFHRHFEGKANIYFITGADAILEILTWKDYRELLSICSFIAVTRPGYCLSKLEETIGAACPEALCNIDILEIPAVAISSTLIRSRVAEGKPIKYLAPEAVTQYIIKHGLYR